MASTKDFLKTLDCAVEQSLRGRSVGDRRTLGENLLDLIPNHVRDIVYGMAMTEWSGAKLRHFVLHINLRWKHLFVDVAAHRLEAIGEQWRSDVCADFEHEGLLGLLHEMRDGERGLTEHVDRVLQVYDNQLADH